MNEAFLLAGARTPIGKFMGGLRDVSATELGSVVIREALKRAEIGPEQVDEVIVGNVISAGLGQAPARQAALGAGLPPTVAAVTVNKVCGSGLKAAMLAAQAIRAGDCEIVVAGGMESMTRAPHLVRGSRDGWKLGDVKLEDAMLLDGLSCPFDDCAMGMHAEYTAEKHHVSREDQDRYAVESHHRSAKAAEQHAFDDEIVPVLVRRKREEFSITADEGPHPDCAIEDLEKLRPAFDSNGTVTAGNASMISDGAAAVVVANAQTADKSPAPWKARVVAQFTSGTEPRDLFIAPVAAVRGVLDKAGLKPGDIDLYEINEAFASQMLACIRELQLDPEIVNVNGGGISLGHPIGASGARVLVTLLAALHKRRLRRGLATLCLGGGNAVAMVIERD